MLHYAEETSDVSAGSLHFTMSHKAVRCSTTGRRSLEGVGLPAAFNTDALFGALCVQRRADTAARGRARPDSTMTAANNTYDVIVVGGGISGRCNIIKLNFAQ